MKFSKKIIILILIIIFFLCIKVYIKERMMMEKPKVLNCTTEVKTESYTAKDTITFYFYKDYYSLQFYVQNLVMDYGSNETLAEEHYQIHKDSCDEANALSGFSCSVEKSNKSQIVTSKLGVVVSELSDGSEKYTTLKGKNVSYYYVKKMMMNFDPPYICEEQK